MKVELHRSYVTLGVFNLENYSDETWGRFIKELLSDSEDHEEISYKELSIKIIQGDLE